LILVNVTVNDNMGQSVAAEKVFLINATISGNTGTGAMHGHTIYNTVITNNSGWFSDGIYYNSVVDGEDRPGILTPPPKGLVDRGDNNLYPLTMDGGKVAGNISASYDASLAALLKPLLLDPEIIECLTKDAAGRPRIQNGIIDLGAFEE
jgi:hypothetical protein